MTDPTAGSLPAANCENCERLAIVEWNLDGEDLWSACIHCGTRVEVETYVSLSDAVSLGYVAPGFEEPHGDRGCRDGQCGVRQPTSDAGIS